VTIRARLAEGWRNFREAFTESEPDHWAHEADMAATTNRERTRAAERYGLPLDPIAHYYGAEVHGPVRIVTPEVDDAQRRYEAGLAPYDDAERALHAHWDEQRYHDAYEPIMGAEYTGDDVRLMSDDQLVTLSQEEADEIQASIDELKADRQARWASGQEPQNAREAELFQLWDSAALGALAAEAEEAGYSEALATAGASGYDGSDVPALEAEELDNEPEHWAQVDKEEAAWEARTFGHEDQAASSEPATGQREAEFITGQFMERAEKSAHQINARVDEIDAANRRAYRADEEYGPASAEAVTAQLALTDTVRGASQAAITAWAQMANGREADSARAADLPVIDGQPDPSPRLARDVPLMDEGLQPGCVQEVAYSAASAREAGAFPSAWTAVDESDLSPDPQPPVSNAERDAMRSEYQPGNVAPDPYSGADVTAWRAGRGGYEADGPESECEL
jgi:hypothetical protein